MTAAIVTPAFQSLAAAALRIGCLYGLVIGTFVAALYAANSIPDQPISDHVRASFSHENYRHSPTRMGRMDHYTECIVLTMGLGEDAARMTALKRSLLSPTVGDCEETRRALLESASLGFNYWRYWHGYQVVSRPILYFTDAYGLRLTCFLLFSLSFLAFVHAVGTHVGLDNAVISAIALLSAPMYSQLYLVHVSMVWAIGFLLAALLLRLGDRSRARLEQHYLWLFGVAGMLTAYVDSLTNPLVTLTIPLLALHWKGDWPGADRSRPAWIIVMMIVAAWATGYFGSWSAKWALASLAGQSHVAGSIADQVAYRLGGPVGPDGKVDVTIMASVGQILGYSTIGLIAVSICLAAALLRSIRRPDRLAGSDIRIGSAVTFLVIFLLPFAWIMLARNHSTLHAWLVAPILYPSVALAMGAAWQVIRKRPQR